MATKDLVNEGRLASELTNKQDTIFDLSTIRSGASLGSTAVQKANVSAGQYKIYGNNEGVEVTIDYHATPSTWKIAQFNGNGCLASNEPSYPNEVATKNYVDTKLGNATYNLSGANGFSVSNNGSFNSSYSVKDNIINLKLNVSGTGSGGYVVVANTTVPSTIPTFDIYKDIGGIGIICMRHSAGATTAEVWLNLSSGQVLNNASIIETFLA